MRNKSKDNVIIEREGNVKKNLEFLANVDLQEVFDIQQKNYEQLVKLHWDLMEALHIDDNIVFTLKNNKLELSNIETLESVVEAFDYNNKFLTLLEKNEEIYKEVYGDSFFKTKRELAKRNKWRTSKGKINKSSKTTMQ